MTARFRDIAERLSQAILAHRLAPGTKLGEREVGELFGVSRIVVRQALIRLAEEGLVAIARNRGAFVARPTMQEAVEIYDALILIEQGVIVDLCQRLSRSGLAELFSQIERQQQATAMDNERLADHLGTEFHDLLVSLSRNRVITEIHQQLTRRVKLLRMFYHPHELDYEHLCLDHKKLTDLIERRQVRRAQELIADHYRHVLRGYRFDDATVKPQPLARALLAPVVSVTDQPVEAA
jgi:DNA-binding GntR family transcriptional regulator